MQRDFLTSLEFPLASSQPFASHGQGEQLRKKMQCLPCTFCLLQSRYKNTHGQRFEMSFHRRLSADPRFEFFSSFWVASPLFEARPRVCYQIGSTICTLPLGHAQMKGKIFCHVDLLLFLRRIKASSYKMYLPSRARASPLPPCMETSLDFEGAAMALKHHFSDQVFLGAQAGG